MVMHLVDYSGGGGATATASRGLLARGGVGRGEVLAPLNAPAESCTASRASARRPSRAFRTIFNDFRQSYVLRYSPEGAARGWHPIVRARRRRRQRDHPCAPGLLRELKDHLRLRLDGIQRISEELPAQRYRQSAQREGQETCRGAPSKIGDGDHAMRVYRSP